MKKHIYPKLVALFLLASNLHSQEFNLSTFLIPQELSKNANAIIRNESLEVTIVDVDEMIVHQKKVITILNKSGDKHSSIYQHYDNDTKITKLSAFVYNQSGSEIKKYSKSKFIDVSAVSGGTLYSDSRVKFVDYTPISYPYTIVFESEYKTSSTGFIPRWFPMTDYYVAVEKSSYKLNNPKQITIRKKEKSFANYKVKDISSNFTINYLLENQSAIKKERLALPSRDFMPYLILAADDFSLKGTKGKASNWEEFGKWMYKSLLEGRDVINEPTKTEILELTKEIDDPIEKAKIVYDYVQNKTRYISVQVGIGGWEPIAASEVDKVGYGDCKGLTNYTKALLGVAGVTSYYTVVYAKEKRNLDKNFTSIQGNHVILNIPNGGNDVWLECTSQIMPFGFLGDFTDDRDVLVITPEGGVIKHTPAYLNEQNSQTTKSEIQLLKNGDLTAKLVRVSKGTQYDNKFYRSELSEDDLYKGYKTRDWSYINNLEILSATLKNDEEKVVFTENLEISIKSYASINENEYLFRVNVFNKNNYVPKRYRERKLPLKIDRGYKDLDEFTIKVPEGYKISLLPESKELTSKFGTYKLSFEKKNDEEFTYKKTLFIKNGVYPKEDYKAYRSFRKSISKLENLRISIVKK
jgi:transglutaminase-like putative cysteine protease